MRSAGETTPHVYEPVEYNNYEARILVHRGYRDLVSVASSRECTV